MYYAILNNMQYGISVRYADLESKKLMKVVKLNQYYRVVFSEERWLLANTGALVKEGDEADIRAEDWILPASNVEFKKKRCYINALRHAKEYVTKNDVSAECAVEYVSDEACFECDDEKEAMVESVKNYMKKLDRRKRGLRLN